MAEKIDLNTFLKDNELDIVISKYNCSPEEPVLTDSMTTLFSKESHRLTKKKSSFELFNMNSEFYVWNDDFNAVYQRILSMQAGNTQILNIDENYEQFIIAMIGMLNKKGYTVQGCMQEPTEGWTVLDDNLLNVALHKADESEGSPLNTVTDQDGTEFVINEDQKAVLLKNKPLEKGIYRWEKVFALCDAEGNGLIEDITFRQLGLTLLGFLKGLSIEQLKARFLWPDFSDELLSKAKLFYEIRRCTNMRIIDTLEDLQSNDETDLDDDDPYFVNVYQYYDSSDGAELQSSIPASDLPDFFKSKYSHEPVDIEEPLRKLSDEFVNMAADLDLLILRHQNQLEVSNFVSDIQINDGKGSIGINANSEVNDNNYHPIESYFDVEDRHSYELVEKNLTINELLGYLWMQSGKTEL